VGCMIGGKLFVAQLVLTGRHAERGIVSAQGVERISAYVEETHLLHEWSGDVPDGGGHDLSEHDVTVQRRARAS